MDTTNITSSLTFCSAPWDSLNIDQTGRVSSCMHMREEIGNLKHTSLDQILVGPKLTSIKQSIAAGEWNSACSLCKELEDSSGQSGRTVRQCSQATKELIDKDIEYFEPHHLVVNWSNLCNLSCVYCNPETSTAWQAVKKIPIDFVRNDQQALINIMQEKGHMLEGLTLGGGEPLLQKGLLTMLKHLDPQKVNVAITTNLSIDITKNEIYQELKTWPRVDWMISFDNATAEKFEYVRNGASWDMFTANIAQMKTDQQKIMAHPAYSIYNAFDLTQYYEYCTDLQLDIFWCELTNPWDLDARRLPIQLRQQAVDEIDQVTARWSHTSNLGLYTLQNYRKQLLDNSYVFDINKYTTDVLGFHHKIEKELGKTTQFQQLWPELTKKMSNAT